MKETGRGIWQYRGQFLVMADMTKSKQVAASEPNLVRDIDHAIQTVEKGDFRTFLEQYARVELLRRLRQEGDLGDTSLRKRFQPS